MPKETKKKEETVEEARTQFESFKAQIQELREKGSHLSVEAKKQFEQQAKELEKLLSEAELRYGELRVKAGENWTEVRAFVELTNKALRHSFNYFMSHYRKKGE
jgi:septal ring factor EnvC (AmiA/AmiB activator)